jgi:hypothetical protein
MKKHPIAASPSTEIPFVRPNWPWWIVLWKAFITLFIIAVWGMLFMWALLIGAWFSPVPNSAAVVWEIILSALLNILPAWALWALSVSVWTEHQNMALKGGLIIGTLFSAFFVFNAAQKATYHGDPTASAINQELALPFCLLTFVCLIWELGKQFKPKKTGS